MREASMIGAARALGLLLGAAAAFYGLLARGSLTVDLGVGRRLRPLGPLTVTISAPRDVVFDVIAEPYLGRTPRALERKLRVLERSADFALAAHFTPVGRFVATTVETIRFQPPEYVHFRLVRGPVPHVVEQFELREHPQGTQLHYTGELGTDLWGLGEAWGRRVARRWNAAVRASLDGIKTEAERRASRRSG